MWNILALPFPSSKHTSNIDPSVSPPCVNSDTVTEKLVVPASGSEILVGTGPEIDKVAAVIKGFRNNYYT